MKTSNQICIAAICGKVVSEREGIWKEMGHECKTEGEGEWERVIMGCPSSA